VPGLAPGPIFNRTSPPIDCDAANRVRLIHPTENQNGLLILWAGALVTEVFAGSSEDQGIVTLKDSADTTLGITFTAANATGDAVGDILAPAANTVAIGATSGSALVIVPAGLGVDALVTQLVAGTPTGAMKVTILAVPIA
jgi:hypothetical protein